MRQYISPDLHKNDKDNPVRLRWANNKSISGVVFSLLFFFISAFFISCEDDNEEIDNTSDNVDFYNHMLDWYYWNQEIPDLDPNFYSSIPQVLEAIRYQPLDRWSYITNLDEFLAFFQESRMIGYGFGSAFDSQGDLRVSFVYNTTDLYEQGVRRSWIIKSINGNQITAGSNISNLLGDDMVGVSNDFVFINTEGEEVAITSEKDDIVMNTVLHHEIIDLSGLSVGYLVLQGFTEPTEEELLDVFTDFKQQGIDELILDLRYNSGGATGIANSLAAMIGGSAVSDEVFARYVFNNVQGPSNNTEETFNEVDLGTQLELNRVITIGTSQTASASELIINSLKPFMQVSLIGENTHGKPVGMIPFANEQLNMAIVTINFRIDNADGEGEYYDGLQADISANDDLTRFFGDPDEQMLNTALTFIESGIAKSSPMPPVQYKQPYEYMTGLDRIIGAH